MLTSIRASTDSSGLYAAPESAPDRLLDPNDILVCATSRKVYAIHKTTGERIWRSDFVSAMSSTKIISLFVTDLNTLLVAGDGETACFDLFTGKRNWSNTLWGCGFEKVGIVCTSVRGPTTTRFQGQRTQPPAYSDTAALDPDVTSTQRPPAYCQTPIAIACTNGKCVAMDARTGLGLWRFECPSGGRKMPSVLVDPPNEHGNDQRIFIGCGKMVYCLDALSGRLFWSMKISNAKFFGQGPMTMATAWSSQLAAQANTAFNQFPSAHKQSISRPWRSRRHPSQAS
ncbi:hypothetical protein BX666DRAFT_876955 [Dichotomocladium elegans]|nr:hypothetical protein BX666DRAFT_876955 [Dichotomocladium elegans]